RSPSNKSLDARGGSAFRNSLGAAEGALIHAAASTQTFGTCRALTRNEEPTREQSFSCDAVNCSRSCRLHHWLHQTRLLLVCSLWRIGCWFGHRAGFSNCFHRSRSA